MIVSDKRLQELRAEFHEPFGPVMTTGRVSKEILDGVNHKSEQYFEDKSTKDYGPELVGTNVQEIQFPNEDAEELGLCDVIRDLAQSMTQFYAQRNKVYNRNQPSAYVESYDFIDFWVNKTQAGDYNPIHSHGSMLSGILYLKVPNELREESVKSHYRTEGHTEFHCPTQELFSNNAWLLLPPEGTIILFPSWVAHTVYPFRNQNIERRTMSFNLNVRVMQTNNQG